MFQKTSIILSLIVSIFLCVNFSSVSRAQETTNAADLYVRAQSLLTDLPRDFTIKTNEIIYNGWQDGNNVLKEFLSKNKESMSEFKKATKLTQCEFNSKASIEDVHRALGAPYLNHVMLLARLVLIEGRLYEKENKFDLALENYLHIQRFINHLANSKEYTSTNAIIRKILQNYSYNILVGYINRKEMGTKEYSYILNNLVSLRKSDTFLENSVEEQKALGRYLRRMDLAETKKGIKKCDEKCEAFWEAYLNESDILADEFFQKLTVAYKENNVDAMIDDFSQAQHIDEKPLPLALAEATIKNDPVHAAKSVYFTLLSLRKSLYKSFANDYYIPETRLDILILASAIKLYESENNNLPDSLQVLVPRSLSELPKDPFNNFNDFKYEKKDSGWILYSLGPDKQDNQGVILFNEEDMVRNKTGDIVFSSP